MCASVNKKDFVHTATFSIHVHYEHLLGLQRSFNHTHTHIIFELKFRLFKLKYYIIQQLNWH